MEKDNALKSNLISQEGELPANIMRIVKGVVLAISLSLILLLIFALLLTYTNISEDTMMPVVMTIVGISILIGSTICARKIKKNGIVNGGLVGLIYVLLLYLISSLCLVGFSLTMSSFIMLIVGLVTGMLGGIIGVNLNKH